MDQFDARLRFTTILQNLNKTFDTTSTNAIKFLVKYSNYEEDLYSCILEELEQSTDLTQRLAIFYFIETLCIETSPNSPKKQHRAQPTQLDLDAEQEALEKAETNYHQWITRDLQKIIEKVVPEVKIEPSANNEQQKMIDTLGNIQAVRSVLEDFLEKGLLAKDEFKKLNRWLTTREHLINQHFKTEGTEEEVSENNRGEGKKRGLPNESDGQDGNRHSEEFDESAWQIPKVKRFQSTTARKMLYNSLFLQASKLASDEVQRRMNDSRERTKRSKERIWEVDYNADGKYAEFERLWSVIGSDDIKRVEQEDDEDDEEGENYDGEDDRRYTNNQYEGQQGYRHTNSRKRKKQMSRSVCIKRGILTAFDFEKMEEENDICMQALGEDKALYFS